MIKITINDYLKNLLSFLFKKHRLKVVGIFLVLNKHIIRNADFNNKNIRIEYES